MTHFFLLGIKKVYIAEMRQPQIYVFGINTPLEKEKKSFLNFTVRFFILMLHQIYPFPPHPLFFI